LGEIFYPVGQIALKNVGGFVVGGLNGVVVRFGIAVKIFFHRKEATDIVTFGIKRDGGESPGNSAVAFDKGVMATSIYWLMADLMAGWV